MIRRLWYKLRRRKISYTCIGKFDIETLNQIKKAKRYGNYLIVGINRKSFRYKNVLRIAKSIKFINSIAIQKDISSAKIIKDLRPEYFITDNPHEDEIKELVVYNGKVIKI